MNAIAECQPASNLYVLGCFLPTVSVAENEPRVPWNRRSRRGGACSEDASDDARIPLDNGASHDPPALEESPATARAQFRELVLKQDSVLVERVRISLEEDRQDTIEEGLPVPPPEHIRLCLDIVEALAPAVVLRDDIRKAAAIESTGAVALVVQSLTTGRRATFRILPDGSIRLTTTDEFLRVSECPASAMGPRETVAWLKGQR